MRESRAEGKVRDRKLESAMRDGKASWREGLVGERAVISRRRLALPICLYIQG